MRPDNQRASHLMPFGPETTAEIQAGNQAALLEALVATALVWVEKAGYQGRYHGLISRTQCVLAPDPARGAVLAAALDLLAVLELSPQGRQAVAQLCGNPVLDESKGE